jgi:hypothetical protein
MKTYTIIRAIDDNGQTRITMVLSDDYLNLSYNRGNSPDPANWVSSRWSDVEIVGEVQITGDIQHLPDTMVDSD